MKSRTLEPGLLQFLRIYVVLMLVAQPIFRRLVATSFNVQVPLDSFLLLTMPVPAFLLVYTWFPWCQRRLGRAFLPVALVIISVQLIVSKEIVLQWLIPAEWREVVMLVLLLQLWLYFQMIVLFIGWQYNMLAVIVTGITLSLVDAALSFPYTTVGTPLYLLFSVIVASRLFTVTGVGLALAWLIQRQREQRHALAEANRKLTQYAATTEQLAISRERNRMARELHDTLAHSLSSVKVQLTAADAVWETNTENAHQMLRNAMAATQDGLTEARRALHALRASPLQDLGLVLAIQNLAESVAARASLQLELNLTPQIGQLAPEVEQCVYRVAQEALSNVARHARANCVRVTLARSNGHLLLTITDNGRGFDPVQVGNAHYGLKGMRERVDMIGGTLEVSSMDSQGTTVRMKVDVTE